MAILEYLCSESNKLYNCAVYYGRQLFLKTGRIIKQAELCVHMVQNPHFSSMYVSSSQQTCNGVAEAFQSFKALRKLFSTGKLAERPRLPKYRKPGLFTVSFPRRWLKLTEGGIRIPLGRQVKAWFGLDSFLIPMPSNLDFESLKEVRLLPRNGCFYAEFVYPQPLCESNVNCEYVLGIDHGIDNWLTCVSNVGTSFIVDGLHLKSLNQWYNKRLSVLKEGRPQGFWSKQLAAITEKRNRQVRDAINKAARRVVNHCLSNQMGTVVFGWNKGQKDSANLGAKTNQKFVQIPTGRLKSRIKQLCEQHGIQFVVTEESYSSKSSFLDSDFLPTFGEKPEGWKASGKRVSRGLYQTAQGWLINADCNGSANIIRKVAVKLGLDLSGISRGALSSPLRVPLWAA
jgi:putative transposase